MTKEQKISELSKLMADNANKRNDDQVYRPELFVDEAKIAFEYFNASPSTTPDLQSEAHAYAEKEYGKAREWKTIEILQSIFLHQIATAYISGRKVNLSSLGQMGELLMSKDGELERLKAEVATLEFENKELKGNLETSRLAAGIATEGLKEASKEIDELKADRERWKRIARDAGNRS